MEEEFDILYNCLCIFYKVSWQTLTKPVFNSTSNLGTHFVILSVQQIRFTRIVQPYPPSLPQLVPTSGHPFDLVHLILDHVLWLAEFHAQRDRSRKVHVGGQLQFGLHGHGEFGHALHEVGSHLRPSLDHHSSLQIYQRLGISGPQTQLNLSS